MKSERSGYVYLMHSEATGWVKIGHSVNPEKRVGEVNAETPGLSWRLRSAMWCEDRYMVERAWHNAFKNQRITPGKEWFILQPEHLNLFQAICEQVTPIQEFVRGIPLPDSPGEVSRDPSEIVEMARARFASRDSNNLVRTDLPFNVVIEDLKLNGQPKTAAVYNEARIIEFDGAVLKLAFSEGQGFYAGMACDFGHMDELGKVLEARLGYCPKLEVMMSGGVS